MPARSLLLLALAGACTATMNMTNTTSSTYNVTAAPTPVPAVQTKFCESDALCQEFGDSSAVCESNACECSVGFEDTLCFPVNDTEAKETPVQVRVGLVFANAVCSKEVAEDIVRIAVEQLAVAFPDQVPATAWTCGSIHVAASYQVPAATAAALDVTAQVAAINTAVQAQQPTAGTATATTTVATTAAAVECAIANAVATVSFDVQGAAVCRVMQCADGFVATDSLDACVVEETTTPDDDLSGGAVAGLVVGVVVAVAAAAGVAFVLTRGAKATEPAQAVNEPVADVEEPATAPEPVANPEEQ